MGIVVMGAVFVDIKGYPYGQYIPAGRNSGRVLQVHGGVSRNVVEDIANVELRPTFVSVVDESGISQDVLSKLKRHQVETRYIRTVPNGLGTWLAVFDHTGDLVAAISSRPDLSEILTILDEQGDEIISAADSVVVEIDLEVPILKRVFELAEKYGKSVYGVVSNMSIAMERRDLLRRMACVVCNDQEAGLLFSEELEGLPAAELLSILPEKVEQARIPQMVVTMGDRGAIYVSLDPSTGLAAAGHVPAKNVDVVDTTGAGDSFFAGVAIGLTYGKTLPEACEIGSRLAASVIATKENVCPRFLPEELGIKAPESAEY